VPENSVGEFFDAVDVLARDYPIAIVGSSGYSNHYDLTAQKLDREHDNVTWFGHVSDDNILYSLWQHAGAYFHGHSVGGTNPALVQAMACGAPIVARNTVYNREVLSSLATYVEARPESIIDGLQSSMCNSAAFDPRATLARARTAYSWDGVCKAYEQALFDSVDSRETVATGRSRPI
jgi:glycosyltransferase involved in cell wall biosynthesis